MATAVLNISRGTVIASDARFAVSLRDRRRGLLGRESMEEGEAMVIEHCRQVHTFGMRFPIDVAFIDRDGVVVRSCHNLVARRISPVAWRARRAVELAAGTLRRTDTWRGDKIQFADYKE